MVPEADEVVKTPGRYYFDAKTASERFEQPRASLSYDTHGRAIYGLAETPPVRSRREEFEHVKFQENMKLQEEQLRPNTARQSLKQTYEETIRTETLRLEEKLRLAKSAHVGTNHHLYRMSEDNPLRVTSSLDPAQPNPDPHSRGHRIQAEANKVFRESTIGPTILGDFHRKEDMMIERKRQQNLQNYMTQKQQDIAELELHLQHPHGLTPAQQRQYREQGFRIGGLGFGDTISTSESAHSTLR